jgi:hypothetical protein
MTHLLLKSKLLNYAYMLHLWDEEIATLRAQVAEANRSSTPQNTPPSPTQTQASAHVTLDAVQRMITESMRAHHMQSQYAMRPGYMKPYPPEVDLVPLLPNYRQPQFTKFHGNGSPHEHIAHFLAACQDTAWNLSGPLLLRQFVQTLSGPAFSWYSKLAPGSITTWEQMNARSLSPALP